MSKEVAEEYVSSLAELTNNSKPHINMLTMLADDNIVHAPAIVDAVEKHLQKVPPDIKLPVLYLIDSIVKNVGQAYTELFSQNIVDMFCDVFAKVDEKTRAQMFKLRQTWNNVFPLKSLFILDTKVNKMDPAWPITAHPPPTIHVNPKFFNVSSSSGSTATPPAAQASSAVLSAADAAIKEQLLKKQKKLLELQQEKLELELMQTKAKLEEQQKQLEKQTGHLKSADSLAALSKLIKKDGGKFTVLNTKSSKSAIVTSSQTVSTKSQLNKTLSKVEVKPTAEVKPTEAVKSSVTKIPEQTIHKSNILLKPYAAAEVKLPSKSETAEKFKSITKPTGVKTEARVKIQEAVPGKSRGLQDPRIVQTATQQVRIAPVSSQLISAARRARDPRIRKMESAENASVTSVSGINVTSSHMAVGMKSSSASVSDSSRDAATAKTKTKTEMNIDHSKSEIKIPGKRSSDNGEKALSHKPSDSERTINKNHEEAVVNIKLKLQKSAQSIPEKSSVKGQDIESTAPVKADRSEKFIPRHSDTVKLLYNKNLENSDKPVRTVVNKSSINQTQTFSDASAANKNFSDSDKQTKNVDSVRALNNKANDKSSIQKQSENSQKFSIDFERPPYVPENVNVVSSKLIEQTSPKCEFTDEHTKVPIVDDKASKFLVSEDRYNSKNDYDERTLLLVDSKMTYTKLKSDISDDLFKKTLSNEELDRRKSPQSSEKRIRRSDQKMTIMEKMLTSTEVDEASPSPPPPPVISDKFKEMKPSSLSRLRICGRKRDGSESPPGISTTTISTTTTTIAVTTAVAAPVVSTSTTTATAVADIDLRQPPVPLIGDQKNDVVAITTSADKDVDLRQLPPSPKKRSSVDRSDPPPPKKSKAEMFHDNKQESSWEGGFENDQAQNYCHNETRLFGSEDVDLRPQLGPAPLPSPPPPPIISHSPPPPSDKEDKENASERWAKYKQQKPENFKSSFRQNNQFKSSPAFRRGQGPFAQYDRRRLLSQEDEDTWLSGRQWYGEDTDMRTSFILNEANKQLRTGNITELQYQKVLSEVVTMNEKQKLAEAQFKDEEEERMLYEKSEELEPISDDEGSFTGSLSPTQNDEAISSIPDPNTSSKPDHDSETSNADQANLEPYDPGDSVAKHDSADVDHRMYTKGECKLHSGMLDVPTSCSESGIDNRIPLDVSRLEPTNEAGEVTYKRLPSQREDQRPQRQDRKQRRRKEDRDHRDKPYRKTRFNQIGPGNWVPFDGRHKNIDSQMDMEYSDSRIPHKDFIHNQVLSADMSIRNKGSSDNRNFQDSSEMSYPMNIHASRFGNDSNLIETGHKDYPPPIHSLAPWDRPRQPPPVWMRGTAPPLLRYPPPLLMKPPCYTTNRWRIPPPGTAPMRPMFDSDIRFTRFLPPNMVGRFPLPGEIPRSDPVILDMIAADPTVSIFIDNKYRDIRFYGETAVALMDWDDPREMSFVSGQRRKIVIDDRESFILTFNTPYKEVLIDGQPHRIKLGAPTRELYIDGKFYEIRFGGPPVNIDIGGKIRSVQLDGPTPTVVRSGIKRSDLVLGKIKLIVDAQIYFPVFLDAKPQRFDIEGIPYILQFVEALQTVLINGVPFKAEFGGLPKPIVLNGKKHFFRLSSLPRGITPGHVTIINMEGGRLPTPPPSVLPPPPQIPLALQLHDMDIELDNNSHSSDPMLHLTAEPNLTSPSLPPVDGQVTTDVTNIKSDIILNPQDQNSPIQPPVSVSSPAAQAPSNPLDMLASLMPTNPPPQVSYSYSVENDVSVTISTEPASQETQTQATSGMIPFLTGEINVSELLQKLVASGIVPGSFEPPKTPNKEKPVEPESDAIKPVDFLKTETLKTRQPGLISTLYSGIQCSSCGVRFAPEQTMKYSQHLDWHFRQNRRDKDSARTAQSRKWYYDVSDWIQFEEIEDLEERAQSWFESQVGQNSINAEAEEPAKEIPSVAAGEFGEDAACEICRDKFEQFYNEEREEWHLRQAIKVDNKLYHPICHQDYRASLDAPIEISLDESTPKEDEAEPSSTVVDDDNDDVIECEIIKEEVPFEDLTVSDCESVHDEKEEKQKNEAVEAETSNNSQSEINDTETKDEGMEPTKSEDVVDVKDDASQDVSSVDFETVVKNIKKEPVDDGDLDGSESGAKNGKEDVPLPEPVVDTTHVEVSCSIDGNLQFEENLQLAVSAPPKIKINITKPLTVHAPRDSKESESDVPDDAETPATSSGTSIVVPPPQALLDQPPPPGEEPTPIILPRKPRLVGKKLQELPPVSKGTELSGLCSIM